MEAHMPKIPTETARSPIAAPASWPMTFVWLGDHWTQDWMRLWSGAARIGDPVGAAQTEGLAASSLARDWIVAMGALWTLPISAWLAAQKPTSGQPR
jgi:hypothetical protein